MALFSISGDKLNRVPTTTFVAEAILEQKHLQRMLRTDSSPLGEDLLVLAEEYGEWEDSNRRIDLLCLDKQGGLVVVEIKRTQDGGHMELQAIRYAAMVSSMTMDQAVSAHAKMLGGENAESLARNSIADFLGIDSTEDTELIDDVRIILASADFSTEITTAVIWLNQHGLDIRCIRLRPYKIDGQILIDATQTIPLPEAADYEVKIREKVQESKKVIGKRQEILRKFWAQLIDASIAKTDLFRNRSTTTDHWLSAGLGRSGFGLNASLTEDRSRVECYIRIGKDNEEASLSAFNALLAQRASIEANFGDTLLWEDLPNRSGCRICKDYFAGGWKSPEAKWPELQSWLIDCAIRLERALKQPIQAIQI